LKEIEDLNIKYNHYPCSNKLEEMFCRRQTKSKERTKRLTDKKDYYSYDNLFIESFNNSLLPELKIIPIISNNAHTNKHDESYKYNQLTPSKDKIIKNNCNSIFEKDQIHNSNQNLNNTQTQTAFSKVNSLFTFLFFLRK